MHETTGVLDVSHDQPRELILLERGRELIQEARSIDELKQIRDQAEALRGYLRQREAGLEAQNAAAEIKLRAERRAGEMLREMPKHPGGRPSENLSHDVTGFSDLGIERMQAHRWQQIASIPEEVFDSYLTDSACNGAEITTAGALRIAKQLKAADEERPDPTFDDCVVKLKEAARRIFAIWPEQYREAMGHQLISLGEQILRLGELRP